MPSRRTAGDGMIRQKKQGLWEGRIIVGHKENGSNIFRYVYGKTKKETAEKLRRMITEFDGVELNDNSYMTLSEWLETWQKWHGWDIIDVDYEDLKEGMFYPQDFHVFRHGFLWHSNFSSFDKESDLLGSIHYYYDIDPDSDIPIKEQMEQFMRKIYENVDWA